VLANAAILVDAESGRVLYEKNPHLQLPIASTTKIVTALVVRDRLKLNDVVTISKQAANVGEQSIGLVAGEKIKVEDLLGHCSCYRERCRLCSRAADGREPYRHSPI